MHLWLRILKKCVIDRLDSFFFYSSFFPVGEVRGVGCDWLTCLRLLVAYLVDGCGICVLFWVNPGCIHGWTQFGDGAGRRPD
jgi:hypothetical protein